MDALMSKEQTIAAGLKFYWPNISIDTRSGYVDGNTNVRNYPIQSLATAEIVPIAVTELYRLMRENGMTSFMINTIHDSVIVELNPEEEELFRELVVQSFTTHVITYLKEHYNIDFNVKLEADVTISDYWGEY